MGLSGPVRAINKNPMFQLMMLGSLCSTFILSPLALAGQVAAEYVWPVVLVADVCTALMLGMYSDPLARELMGTFVVCRYRLSSVVALGLLAVLITKTVMGASRCSFGSSSKPGRLRTGL